MEVQSCDERLRSLVEEDNLGKVPETSPVRGSTWLLLGLAFHPVEHCQAWRRVMGKKRLVGR